LRRVLALGRVLPGGSASEARVLTIRIRLLLRVPSSILVFRGNIISSNSGPSSSSSQCANSHSSTLIMASRHSSSSNSTTSNSSSFTSTMWIMGWGLLLTTLLMMSSRTTSKSTTSNSSSSKSSTTWTTSRTRRGGSQGHSRHNRHTGSSTKSGGNGGSDSKGVTHRERRLSSHQGRVREDTLHFEKLHNLARDFFQNRSSKETRVPTLELPKRDKLNQVPQGCLARAGGLERMDISIKHFHSIEFSISDTNNHNRDTQLGRCNKLVDSFFLISDNSVGEDEEDSVSLLS